LGIALFLTPITYDGKQTIVIGVLSNGLMAALGSALPLIVTIIFVLSGLISFVATVFKPRFLNKWPLIDEVFGTTPIWLMFRMLAGVFWTMTYLQVGPE